jgi:hypothetical protein
MGFFEKLFGKKNENENTNKPFHLNVDDAEKLDWFKRTKPWYKVDEKIIKAVIKKFNGHPMLELFVLFSMENRLIEKYIELNMSNLPHDLPHNVMDDLICSQIALKIYPIGSASLKEFISLMDNVQNFQTEYKYHYKQIMDSLELAIMLDKNQVSAYMGLAIVKGAIGRYSEGLSYAMQGINIANKMLDENIPFHLSDIEEAKTGKQDLESIKEKLSDLIKEYEEKSR